MLNPPANILPQSIHHRIRIATKCFGLDALNNRTVKDRSQVLSNVKNVSFALEAVFEIIFYF